MKIIKIRGIYKAKSDDSTGWLYFNLSVSEQNPFVYSSWLTIDKETIGQFIGLYDADGKQIYEGDIISVNGKYPKLVKFVEEYACFCLANVSELKMEWMDPWHQVSPGWWSDYKREIRVIGNMYENPELLNS